MELVFFLIALVALAVATYTDIRTREVPDWINYGLIAAGLGVRALYSLYYAQWEYLIDGLLGLAIFFGFAYVMFYSGQWGGGDSKCIMGIGALFGIQFQLDSFALSMLVNTFLLGAVYGLAYSIVLAIRHRNEFSKEWSALRMTRELRHIRFVLLGVLLLGLVFGFLLDDFRLRLAIFAVLIFLLLLFYSFLFTKSVERSCMHRWVKPDALTEGDWIVNDVVINKKRICGPKDLGVSKEQIAELIRLQRKGKIKKILMKVGIPFVPSFLMALIATWFWGNLMMPVIFLLA